MRAHPSLIASILVLASCSRAVEPSLPLAQSHDPSIDPARTDAAIDPHRGGKAEEIRIAGISWGRLVDVYAVDPQGGEPVLVAEDLVVGPDVASDGVDFELDTEPITQRTSVTVLHPHGSSAFEVARSRLERGLVPIAEKGLAASELPPWPAVPRDAAIVVRFDDLLDPASVGASTMRMLVGTPPVESFPARVLVDRNHGGWSGSRFLPTRVILDPAVSRLEALDAGTPAEFRPEGLPPSARPELANVAIVLGAGIANLAGHGFAGGRDEVRALRSGGREEASHGGLPDVTPPRVIGVQPVTIDAVAPDPLGGPQDYVADLTFQVAACARAVRPRDVLVTPTSIAIVIEDSQAPAGSQLVGVHLLVVGGPPLATGPASFETPYRPAHDAGYEACFVRFTPTPAAPPDAGVDPLVQVVLRFSEPMDPATITGLESFRIASLPLPQTPHDVVAGTMIPSIFLTEFACTPQAPLPHQAGTSETYFVALQAGPDGATDLSGNPLQDGLPLIPFHLDPNQPTRNTGNYVLRFESPDEDGNGAPEIRGQFLHDLVAGAILPRPVSRFTAVADRTQPVPQLMFALPGGVQTPLSPYGSRLHALWRYCDVGLGLVDESLMNVDVEGLSWSPVGGSVVADQYAEFEMSLAHAGFLPDEVLDPVSLLPSYPQSGLDRTFARNDLNGAGPLQVVHPRQRGYTVDPADQFVATTGTPMMPWPLNRNLPASQFEYFTWRDTALQGVGGPGGAGAELSIAVLASGSGTPGQPYKSGNVPSIGLPLLMEFKCFADAGALGLNSLDASVAINSSSKPHFRAFSTGGVDTGGQTVIVDPDSATVATGGFDPGSFPPGAHTPGVDNVFHIGQMDLVVRLSRLCSVWIDFHVSAASYFPPIVEPPLAAQPAGTQIVFAMRGATDAAPIVQRDASVLDVYGDYPVPDAVQFLGGDARWTGTFSELTGARFVQVRATFVSNAETGQSPRMTALGLACSGP